MIKNLDAIGESLGMKAGEFQTFIDSNDEVEVKLGDIEIVKKTDLATRIANIEKAKYDEGKTAQNEIYNKEFAKAFGLDLSGEQAKKSSIDYFKTAIQTKILADAKIEPDKKINELNGDLEKLRLSNDDWQKKYSGLENNIKVEKNQGKITSTIHANLPSVKNPEIKTLISIEDMGLIFRNKFNPSMNDDGVIVYHDAAGNVLKDKNQSPITIEGLMPDFQIPYISTPTGTGARGKTGTGANTATSFEAFNKEMEEKQIKIGASEYNQIMKERVSAKTLIM